MSVRMIARVIATVFVRILSQSVWERSRYAFRGYVTATFPRNSSHVISEVNRLLLLALVEMVIQGVSTRKITAITEELCGTEFSKSTVSDLCKRLDPIVEAWNGRNLRDRRYPFVLVDAIMLKIREDERVRSRAAMIATGVNEEGYREILGIMLGDSESEASWSEFFSWLKSRDLRGVDIVVSDSHSGLVKALQTQFQGATWQRCQTHFMRNFLDATPKSLHDELYGKVRAILDAPDVKTARLLMDQVVSDYSEKAAKAI